MRGRLALVAALLGGCTLITGDPREPARVPAPDLGRAADAAPCLDILDDPHNCGACGHDCAALPGVVGSEVGCIAGRCDVGAACLPGRAHCSTRDDDGCEADLSRAESCGACGNRCAGVLPLCTNSGAGFFCAPACAGATPDACGGACVSLDSDPQNCGRCGNVCSGTCQGGVCVANSCAAGFHLCAPAGCVSDASVATCGAACTPCAAPANGVATCTAGACGFTCNDGFAKSGLACVRPDFTAQTSGVAANLNAVFVRSASDVFAVGNAGTVLRSAGNGTWSASTPTTVRLNNVWAGPTSALFAVGASGVILRFNEQTWDGRTSNTTESLFGLAGNATLITAGTKGAVASAPAPGDTWTVQTLGAENEHSIWQSSDGTATYVVGSAGSIHFSAGSTFAAQTSGVATYLNGVWGSSKSDVYIVGQSGVILHSTGDGKWTAQTSPFAGTLWWIWGANDHDLYVVGDQGVALHSTGGGTWTTLASGVTTALYAVSGSSSSDVYVVGASGVILHRP
jgi:hypothetical protein